MTGVQTCALPILSQKIPPPMSIIEVEVLAARRALKLAVELGFDHIILEGHSKILHKALLVEGRNFTPYGHLVQDILYLCRFFFPLLRLLLYAAWVIS